MSTVRDLIAALEHMASVGAEDYEVALRVSRGDGVPLRAPVNGIVPEVRINDDDTETRILTLWGNTP